MTAIIKVKVRRKSVVKAKASLRFPSSVSAFSPILLATAGGNYAFSLDINALRLSLNPFYQPTAASITKILTAPGPYVALPTDDILIVKQTVAAPFTINVDWSLRTNPLRVVDGKGDAATNNITITPSTGQTQMALANFSYVIDGNGGTVTLTPLPDRSGAY
jgi:hypothetical protein